MLAALLALQLERRREIALLRACGFTRWQAASVYVQTGAIGLASGVFAIPLGWAVGLVLVHVVNVTAFGWSMTMDFGYGLFLETVVMAVLAALIAGTCPPSRRTNAAQGLRLVGLSPAHGRASGCRHNGLLESAAKTKLHAKIERFHQCHRPSPVALTAVKVGSVTIRRRADRCSIDDQHGHGRCGGMHRIEALARAGSELVRITVNTPEAAAAVSDIRARLDAVNCSVPLVGDFHYNGHRLLQMPGLRPRAGQIPDQPR